MDALVWFASHLVGGAAIVLGALVLALRNGVATTGQGLWAFRDVGGATLVVGFASAKVVRRAVRDRRAGGTGPQPFWRAAR